MSPVLTCWWSSCSHVVYRNEINENGPPGLSVDKENTAAVVLRPEKLEVPQSRVITKFHASGSRNRVFSTHLYTLVYCI